MKKILRRKFLFVLSLAIFLPLAYIYTKMAKPIYQCAATILIEAETPSTTMGASQVMGIEPTKEEKNLFNEIGIIKTHSLIKQSLAPLGFEVSYFSGNFFGKKEKYGYFPFEVHLIDSSAQLYGSYFEVIPKSDTEFELIVEADEFAVSNPKTNSNHDIEQELRFKDTYKYGETINHEYFNFIIKKPDYRVASGAFEDKQLFFKCRTLEGLTNSFKGKLDVEQTEAQGSIIRLQTEGPVVKKQLLFLEQLSKNYIESKKAERNIGSSRKKRYIEIELKSVADSLEKAEKALEYFLAQDRSHVNIGATTTSSLEQLDQLESEKANLNASISYYNQSLKYLKDSSGIDKIATPSLVGIEDPLLTENLIALRSLYESFTEKSQYLGPDNKDLLSIKEQIRSTTEQIKSSLARLVNAGLMKVKTIDSRIASLDQQVSTLPTNEKQRVHLERKARRFERDHEYLTRELSTTEIAEIGKTADARMLDAPRKKGDGPIAPQKKLIMVLGLMGGLLLPFLFVVLFDPYDEDLTELKQLEKYSNLPVVGSVAHFSTKSGIFSSNSDSRWQVEESFRDVCTNVQILLPDEQHNVIGVTSTVPNEGKTFCALNMAINLAASGKKVLLIDSDLRNSDLLQKMGVDGKNKKLEERVVLANGAANGNSKNAKDIVTQDGAWFEYNGKPVKIKGLLNYLNGEVNDVTKVIHSYKEEPNLKFIPANLIDEENPHRLLADKRFELLVKEAKEQYDYIVIDSPPVGLVSDYLLISKYIDLHLVVVRRKVSKFSYLKGIEKIKRHGQLKNVLLLFNDAAGKSLKYGYSNYSYGKVVK